MESFVTSNVYWLHEGLPNACQELTTDIDLLQGASADWWNHMHFQHHSKPNVIDKDPDTRVEPIFVLGDKIPIRVNKACFLLHFMMSLF